MRYPSQERDDVIEERDNRPRQAGPPPEAIVQEKSAIVLEERGVVAKLAAVDPEKPSSAQRTRELYSVDMYRVSGSAEGVARARRPSQRRIWLGALATVIVSLGAGGVLAAMHFVVLLLVLFPLTILLVLGWVGLVVAAVMTAISRTIMKRASAPVVVSGIATAILGGACSCGAAITTSALLTLRDPPPPGGFVDGVAPTFLVASLHNPMALADGAIGFMLGTVLGGVLGVAAMTLAREGPAEREAREGAAQPP